MSLRFYTVNNDYLSLLRLYDKHVVFNHGVHDRPYVGPLFSFGDFSYYIPLEHPKEKHHSMDDSIGLMGVGDPPIAVLSIINMIPIAKNEVEWLDFRAKSECFADDRQYKFLLQNQYQWVRDNEERILRNATKLYCLKGQDELKGPYRKICCNFPLLEKACVEYEYPLEDLQQLPRAIEPDRLYLAAKPVLNKYQLINTFDFSTDGYEEGIFRGMNLHRDFAIFGINAEQEAFIYKRDMFDTSDSKTFDEAFMTSPVTDLRGLEISIGQQFEVMEKSPFLLR